MSHRQKGEHKARHRTHAVKPASLIQAPLAALIPIVPEPIPAKIVRKARRSPAAVEALIP